MIRPELHAAAVRVLFPSRSPYADLESIVLPPDDEDDFPVFLDERFLRDQLSTGFRRTMAGRH